MKKPTMVLDLLIVIAMLLTTWVTAMATPAPNETRALAAPPDPRVGAYTPDRPTRTRMTGAADPAAPGPSSSELASSRTLLDCTVLLVDDDWDQYSGEPYNGTGTLYYTSTLEALGAPYDRWDTWTAGDPALSDMLGYDVVLWFAGYAWDETITPTNEADLSNYLDAGGNLILSAEDYFYDQGLTSFGIDYLGISGYTEDVADIDLVGNAGDPIGDGLGPYTLSVPTSWPSGGSLYPDYADAVPAASEPFRFQTSNASNATDYDGSVFKTVFLAWPLEGLAALDERAEVLGAALTWMCAASEPDIFMPLVIRN